jgi:outer membrane immunogenic protein
VDSRELQVVAPNKTNSDRRNSDRRSGRGFAIAVLAALAAVPAAFAADLPAPVPAYSKAPVPVAPPASWTGFYLGSGLGSRSANVSEQTLSATFTAGSRDVANLMDASNCSSFVCGTPQSLDHTAFRFSPYFGYNWQVGSQWLAGLEGDVGFGSKTSTINGAPLPGAGGFSFANSLGDSFAVKTSWDASARARVGYLVTPDLLVYATGGAAWQRVEATSTCGPHNELSCVGNSFFGFNALFTNSVTDARTKLGWTVGGGIETMAWGHWLLRGEFRYSDFGTLTNTDVRTDLPATDVFTTSYKLRLTTTTALVGAAYKF